jgi:hypothetical protein
LRRWPVALGEKASRQLPQRSRVKPQSLSSRCGRIPVILYVGATAQLRKYRSFPDRAAKA